MSEQYSLHKAACDPSNFYCQDGRYRDRCADVDLVRALINVGEDVNQVDDQGRTPLHVVSNYDAATLLLGAGADPLAGDHDFLFPTQLRSGNKTYNKARDTFYLIKDMQHPVDIDADGFTPLHHVRDAKVAEQLIARGANVNAVANGPKGFGQSPLHLCDHYVAEVLIAHGAYVNALDNHGRTPLDIAQHQPNLIKLLQANGATGKQSTCLPAGSRSAEFVSPASKRRGRDRGMGL